MSVTIPIWITESSLIEWKDTAKLPVPFSQGRLPALLSEGLGGGVASEYEGLVDPAASVGGLLIEDQRDALDAVPEWVVTFDRPLASIDSLGPETPCVLQGAAEGRWLEVLSQPGQVSWADAALGNNIVARGKGIATTLGAIARGEREIASARVTLHMPAANGESWLRTIGGEDLSGIPVIELAAAVKEYARENSEVVGPIQGLTFGCSGEVHAYTAESRPGHRLPSAAYLPQLLRRLLAQDPAQTARLLEEARTSLHLDALEQGRYLRPGAALVLSVTGHDDVIVGEGALTITVNEE